jgi:predicted HNH restriction endonuclease
MQYNERANNKQKEQTKQAKTSTPGQTSSMVHLQAERTPKRYAMLIPDQTTVVEPLQIG